MSSAPIPAAISRITAGPIELALVGDAATFTPALTARPGEAEGIWYVDLSLTAPAAAQAPPMVLRWSLPCTDILVQWRGGSSGPGFPPDWGNAAVRGRACSQAPVICLHSASGENRCTIAVEDAVHLSRLIAGVREEDGTLSCRAELFCGAMPPATRFAARLRLDLRSLPWDLALRSLARWWEAIYPPAPVPDAGKRPMYSTWYSLHQAVDAPAVEAQARVAQAIGLDTVIIDDGWQTLDGQRGYGYCGDWRPERIPDMAGLVRRLHAAGQRVMLWYAVPFIGFHAAAFQRFTGKYLFDDKRKACALLDTRYPEVRQFLIDTYVTAMREWDLDGFKLDFVDAFMLPDQAAAIPKSGMDVADLDESVVRLMTDVMGALRAVKPDVLIEFRQSYNGPVMRTFGNLFRAGDCPVDAIGNRQRVLDIRLLAGSSATHADPQMWHADEPVESAALQLVNTLYGVPQVSVRLDLLPAAHLAMVRFWTAWWTDHRACLMDGDLRVEHPEARYTQATARTDVERITSLYQDVPAVLGEGEPPTIHVVNATRTAGAIIECRVAWRGQLTVRDTTGRIVEARTLNLAAGLHRLAVPPAGLATLESGHA
jgi:alpha-galactosidase